MGYRRSGTAARLDGRESHRYGTPGTFCYRIRLHQNGAGAGAVRFTQGADARKQIAGPGPCISFCAI